MKLGRESLYCPGTDGVSRGTSLMLSLSDRLWGCTVLVVFLAVAFIGLPLVIATAAYTAWFIHENYGFAAFFDAMLIHEKFKLVFWGVFGIVCLGGVSAYFDR
jgi:hypothetical protein